MQKLDKLGPEAQQRLCLEGGLYDYFLDAELPPLKSNLAMQAATGRSPYSG